MVRVPGWIHRAAGGWAGMPQPTGTQRYRRVLPPRIPPVHYVNDVQVDIGPDGVGQATVNAAGQATIQLGPSGFTESWDLAQVAIMTSTGPADTSTAAVYVGPGVAPNYQQALSYAGGGDSIGLAGISIRPGEFVIAQWSGATQGALATLVVAGTKTVALP